MFIFFKILYNLNKRKMNFRYDQLNGLNQYDVEEHSNMFLGFAQEDAKNCGKDVTEAFDHNSDSEYDGQWRSNILISSTESKQRTPFALRHLTSFQERSMDNHGKRLSTAFNQYVCWLRKGNYLPEHMSQGMGLSNLQWETVQAHIRDQPRLTENQKKILISSAHKNTQAELIISQIIEQIPEIYYAGALSIAANLIQQFKKSHLSGRQGDYIENQIAQTYILMSGKLYDRLALLGLANQNVRNHERYFSFIRVWMQVFFLSLNGFLQNPSQRDVKIQHKLSDVSQNIFGRKQSIQLQ